MRSGLVTELENSATRLGAPLFGIAEGKGFSRYEGEHNPSYYLPDARSVIVIGSPLTNPVQDVWLAHAHGGGSYSFINEILGNVAMELATILLKAGSNAVVTPYDGIFAKDAAALAGMGIIGRNNLLVTGEFGPRVRLRTIASNAVLAKTTGQPNLFCYSCERPCWSACPANAFAEGRLDRAACEEYGYKHAERVSEDAYLYCRQCETACPVGRTRPGGA